MSTKPNKPNQEPTLKEQFTSRAFRAGSYSVLISVLAIAVVIVLNLIISGLPETFTNIDLTDADVLALSEQTKQMLGDLDEDVKVYQLIEDDGNEDEYISELLSRYSDLSKHFTYESVNIVLYPNFVSRYTDQTLYENSLIVVSGKRHTVIDYFEVYQYTFEDGSTQENLQVEDVRFFGEEKLTTALDFVTTDILPVVYNLTGHGEGTFSPLLQELVASDNMTLLDLSLMQAGGVPADCSCLIVNTPSVDIADDEKEMILDYLEAGGAMLLVSDYTKSGFPNLNEIMDYYGMYSGDTVILEGNSNHYYSSRSMILPDIGEHDITAAIRRGGYFVMTPVSMPIFEKANHRESLTITPLLQSTKESYIKENFDDRTTDEKENGDQAGPFSIAVAAEDLHGDKATQLVWIGTSFILDDTINTAVSGTNNDFILGCLGWMTGSESAISIHSKSVVYEELNVPSGAANFWFVCFTVIIPVVLLASGGVILYRRRKR